MSLQSEEETRYRLTLAEGYLERARKALASEDFSDTVSEAQLCVENAAKAVVSCFRIPGWSHDPSAELREVLESNQLEIKKFMLRLPSRQRQSLLWHGTLNKARNRLD